MTLSLSERYILYPLLKLAGHKSKESLMKALKTLEQNTKDSYIADDIKSLSEKLKNASDSDFNRLLADAMSDELRRPGVYKI